MDANLLMPSGTDNIAANNALFAISREIAVLRAVEAGKFPECYQLFQLPPSVLIGANQAFEREVRADYCKDMGIDLARRQTGGGAIYVDNNQQCLGIFVRKSLVGRNFGEYFANAANIIRGIFSRLGIETKFKPPNDLQTANRQKIASFFVEVFGDTIYIFATLIKRLDIQSAMKALLVPTEKLTATGLEHAKERMTSIEEMLGREITCQEVEQAVQAQLSQSLAHLIDISNQEFSFTSQRVFSPFDKYELKPQSYETMDKFDGATLRLLLAFEGSIISEAKFACDGHFSPLNYLADLASCFTGRDVKELPKLAKEYLSEKPLQAMIFKKSNILETIMRACAKFEMQAEFGFDPIQASGLMLAGTAIDPDFALENAQVVLVPYCAKPNWCKWRHTIDCVECGKCEVSEAYTFARERNMEVVTITNFEHLAQTLDKMRENGVKSYVGMCCSDFFLKRHHAFRESNMEAVLLDIKGATCYELKEEHLAYQGAFKAQAKLDPISVRKIFSKIPVQAEENKPCLSGGAKRAHEIYGPNHNCPTCVREIE